MTELWKNTFPKDFFNKIWLKVEHEYTYISETKFEKIILFKNGGQNIMLTGGKCQWETEPPEGGMSLHAPLDVATVRW